MRYQKLFSLFLSIAFVTALSACSGGSSTSDSSDGDAVVVEDMSVLPSLNFDFSEIAVANGSLSAPIRSSVAKDSSEGTESRAGCLVKNFLEPVARSQSMRAEQMKCYVNATESSSEDLDVSQIPLNEYGTFLIHLDDEEDGEPNYVAVRLGNFEDGDLISFKMDVCEADDPADFGVSVNNKSIELEITGDKSAQIWSGHVTSHWLDDDGNGGDFHKTSFSIQMDSDDALLQSYDPSLVSWITINGTHGRDPSTEDVTSSTTYNQGFKVNLSYVEDSTIVADGIMNIITGGFNDISGENGGQLYSNFTSSAGAAIMESPDSEGSSSSVFSIGAETDGVYEVFEADESISPYAELLAALDSVSVSDYAITLPDDINEVVAFSTEDSWDCSLGEISSSISSSVKSYIPIDAREFDSYDVCDAIGEEYSRMDVDSPNTCENFDLSGTYDIVGGEDDDCFPSETDGIEISVADDGITYTIISDSQPVGLFEYSGGECEIISNEMNCLYCNIDRDEGMIRSTGCNMGGSECNVRIQGPKSE